MAWPTRASVWGEYLAEGREDFARAANAINRFEPLTMVVNAEQAADARARCASSVRIAELPIDDSWLRDSGPTYIVDGAGKRAAAVFTFNAWGGKYHPFDQDARVGAVIAPAYGISEDPEVFETLRRVFSDRQVVPVKVETLCRGGGGIHCITQQEPLGVVQSGC